MKFGVEASNIRLNLKQNYNQSESKTSSLVEIENNEEGVLLANERIEYQENKRIVAQLREQNRELIVEKRKLEEKNEFLELEIHRQDGIIKNYESELERHRKLVFKRDITL